MVENEDPNQGTKPKDEPHKMSCLSKVISIFIFSNLVMFTGLTGAPWAGVADTISKVSLANTGVQSVGLEHQPDLLRQSTCYIGHGNPGKFHNQPNRLPQCLYCISSLDDPRNSLETHCELRLRLGLPGPVTPGPGEPPAAQLHLLLRAPRGFTQTSPGLPRRLQPLEPSRYPPQLRRPPFLYQHESRKLCY